MEEYQIIILALLVTVREGLVFAKLRKYWKPIGAILRGLIVFLLYPNIQLMLVAAVILYPLYNVSCALGLKQDWYYLGNTGIMDRHKIINYTLQFILVLTTIVAIYLNI